ncbi:MAG: NosD domain-containing protein [Vicinamibacteraceae bacterium]
MNASTRLLVSTMLALSGAALGRAAALGPAALDGGPELRARIAAAAPGATIDVGPGRYTGPFVIDRPLTLVGHGRPLLIGDRTTHVVAIRAADVTIVGFEIRGSGLDLSLDHAGVHVTGPRAVVRGNRLVENLHGVYVRHADGARVEGNTILGLAPEAAAPVDPLAPAVKPGEGELCAAPANQNRRGNGIHIWNATGHTIAGNVIRDTRDGIYFSFVDGSSVRDNDIAQVRYGLHYMYSDDNRFERNVFSDNAAGAALMYSKGLTLTGNRFIANRSHRAYGLLLQSVDDTLISANEIAGNTLGLFLENGHGNRVLDNRIAANYVGIRVSDSSDVNVFAGNRFTGNIHPVETTGGNQSNQWAVNGRGNAWEGALTLDLDRNGIADLPHRELDLFSGLRRDLPAIGLLAGSPAERLLRFVHARLAIPGIGGIVDPAPLVDGGGPPQGAFR